MAALLVGPAVPSPAVAQRAERAGTTSKARGRAEPPKVTADPALRKSLDSVMAISPGASCLTVKIDGTVLYQHNSSSPVVPASTEKLITSAAALDLLGPQYRFTTSAVATATPVNGTLVGDLTLVGGGDPQLTSSIYQAVRHLGKDRTITLLDDLASKVAASGVRHVTGRILGDESRFDGLRTVPSWPARYVEQDQAGPLSALDVDDGYTLEPAGDTFERHRADQPAIAAAQLFKDLLGAKGVKVDGGVAAAMAPAGSKPVAQIQSAPLTDVIEDMLLHSDNQTAELLVKELGKVKGTGGTTAAGVELIRAWRAQHGLTPPGSVTVDGSGLDPSDRVTCDEMATLLDTTGGRTGTIAASLPVAATSGTLLARFRGSPAAGKLRAKTGSLNSVTALTGFVDLVDGGTATFSYVANGAPVSRQVLAAQDLLATVLATYRPPCPAATVHQVVAPTAAESAALATLGAGPAAAASLPGTLLALDVLGTSFRTLSDRCLSADPAAGVALVP